MAASKPRATDLDEKWEQSADITLRRFVYGTLSGTAAGLVLFRSPTKRWAAIAFGAGLGLGSAYTDASRVFSGNFTTSHNSTNQPPSPSSESLSLPQVHALTKAEAPEIAVSAQEE